MLPFDCLAPDCPILGRRLLEASAGTGKTFAMEHIFVRLILEGGCHLEEILAVTFTRAATRQLKERIRANLVRVDRILQQKEKNPFPYLEKWIGSISQIRALQEALLGFDRALIFTIHGFCARMLKEFSFEADLTHLSSVSLEKTEPLSRQALLFLKQEMDPSIVCPEQMALLLGKFPTLEEIRDKILKTKPQKVVPFQELWNQFSTLIRTLPQIAEDFSSLRLQYKGYKEEMDEQAELLKKAVLHPDDPSFFRKLIYAKGTIFSFFSPNNRKMRAKDTARFFEEASSLLGPIVQTAVSSENILANISSAWKDYEEGLFDRGLIAPDALLSKMRKAVEIDSFCLGVRNRFRAVMIDEFQDTDQVQWEIFKQVFIRSSHCHTLYLVGDPKQSIYRFRNADIYTYFAAKDELGEEACFSLETNYRSTPSLISSLNALFSRSCLPLPKRGEVMDYRPVKAGLSIAAKWEDGKASLHWMVGSEKEVFPYTAQEIQRLYSKDLSIAVLVRDRYEMEKMIEALQEHGIPFFAKSKEPLGESLTFSLLREVFAFVSSPFDESAAFILAKGPFAFLLDKGALYWKRHIEEEGLSSFFRTSSLCQKQFSQDLQPILEALLAWEYTEGFSWQGLFRFLQFFSEVGIEEGGKKIQEAEEGAVEVMTLHASKGLEFDVVFALGLSSSRGQEDEEENAEKLRLLYVAMTRAKYRLYVPWLEEQSEDSPLSLFAKGLPSSSFLDHLKTLSEKESVSFEKMILNEEVRCLPSIEEREEAEEESFVPYTPLYVQSFSSFLRHAETEKVFPRVQTEGLPRGKEMGQEMHDLFEGIFSCPEPIWQNMTSLSEWVLQFLNRSFLLPWKEEVQQMVIDALHHPLFGDSFCLKDLQKDQVRPELEFFYVREEHFMKGFIDLVFMREGKLYFLDWKTNVLEQETPEEVMERQGYNLQAALYKEALERIFHEPIGGAFYAFIRERKWLFLEGEQK